MNINQDNMIQDNIIIDPKLIKFVKTSTINFDDSHNHEHALKVSYNAHKIMKTLNPNYNQELLSYVAMLHDVCDHKYKELSITREELINFINENLSSEHVNIVMKIIDNVSWSKEVRGETEQLNEPYNLYLTALTDADRLEAIGEIGINRCIEYTLSRGEVVPDDVIIHCNEKLLRLLPEGFIKTELGREMAQPLHDYIVDYVSKNSN